MFLISLSDASTAAMRSIRLSINGSFANSPIEVEARQITAQSYLIACKPQTSYRSSTRHQSFLHELRLEGSHSQWSGWAIISDGPHEMLETSAGMQEATGSSRCTLQLWTREANHCFTAMASDCDFSLQVDNPGEKLLKAWLDDKPESRPTTAREQPLKPLERRSRAT